MISSKLPELSPIHYAQVQLVFHVWVCSLRRWPVTTVLRPSSQNNGVLKKPCDIFQPVLIPAVPVYYCKLPAREAGNWSSLNYFENAGSCIQRKRRSPQLSWPKESARSQGMKAWVISLYTKQNLPPGDAQACSSAQSQTSNLPRSMRPPRPPYVIMSRRIVSSWVIWGQVRGMEHWLYCAILPHVLRGFCEIVCD